MPGFRDLVQKAFYLGVGAASYAAEKAGTTLSELRTQAQKLADEMVARGEMNAEEAKRMVEEIVSRAQAPAASTPADSSPPEPRHIEILAEDVETTTADSEAQAVEELRQQVAKLQEELRRLKRE